MMFRSVASLLVTVVLLTINLAWLVPEATAEEVSTLIASGELTNDVSDALTDGIHVAWVYGADSPATSCNTLNVAPLDDPADRWSKGIQRGSAFAVSDDVVVWSHAIKECRQYTYDADPGIYGQHLITGQTYTVTTDDVIDLEMLDGTVVWMTQSQVRRGDLEGSEPITIAEITGGMHASQLRFDGGQVFWLEFSDDRTSWSVMNAQQGQALTLLQIDSEIRWFDVNGSWLFWLQGAALTVRDIITGETMTVADDVTGAASTDGRYLIWEHSDDYQRSELRAWDLTTGSRFTLANYQATDGESVGVRGTSLSRGAVAWDVWSLADARTEIRAARLQHLLPSGSRPDPGKTDPNWTFYPETGHYLSWGFRTYWEANGGLPVFGYPLTEEFIETNADTGADYTVQFTERQRFEWHPENAGTPYEVLLGRLGFEQAADLGLLDDEPFRYRGDDEGPDAGCTYFRETGHYACHDFVFYWREHGLEMGDPGISYRESLALFGYPLSEPFMTTNSDGDTGWTQYFERSVFELHPENLYPYRVLLRRLGAEELVGRSWAIQP